MQKEIPVDVGEERMRFELLGIMGGAKAVSWISVEKLGLDVSFRSLFGGVGLKKAKK